jgi:transcriptional regulator with XRE-family HTH domain
MSSVFRASFSCWRGEFFVSVQVVKKHCTDALCIQFCIKILSMDNFTEWLMEELNRRDWTPAALANKAGINAGSLSHILNKNRNPGPEVCVSIARALNIPPEEVFRRAGLLPTKPLEATGESELLYLYRQLDQGKQILALSTLRAWVESRE